MKTLLLVTAAALSLGACKTIEYRDREVIRTVPVPVHQPCPKPEDIPAQPSRVSEDHPVMPTDGKKRELILGGKVSEWQGYGEEADAIMTACSKAGGEDVPEPE